MTAFVSAPLSAGIILLSPGFVRIFLGTEQGNNWLPMILPMQILAVWGFIRSIGATAGPVFHAVNRPEIGAKLGLLKLITLAALIYPLTKTWGLAGTSIAVVLAALLNNPIADYMAIRVTGCGAKPFLEALAYPVAASLVMALGILGLHAFVGPGYGLGVFVLSILLGASLYFAMNLLFVALLRYDIRRAFRKETG